MDMSLIWAAALVAVVFFLVVTFGKSGDKRTGSGKSRAESELLRLTLGDKNKAERLIQYEMRKKPGLSRAEAARAAVESIRYDNR